MDELDIDEGLKNQSKNSNPLDSKPWLYKKGQSGNLKGRPKGSISMKQWVKGKLSKMTQSEREIFLQGVPKEVIWKMAEGNPKNDVDFGGEVKTKIIIADE